MQYSFITDVTIIGAGPSGCSTAMFLSKYKIPHFILDKSVFPRDKVCGDALSSKSLYVLNKIDPSISEEMKHSEEFYPFFNAIAVAPNQKMIRVQVAASDEKPAGYIIRRTDFDYFLVKRLNPTYATLLQNAKVTKLQRIEKELRKGFEITYSIGNQEYIGFTKCLVGGDGDRSIVKKTFAPAKLDPKHYAAALRAYYKDVADFSEKSEIEVYFPKALSPGYFWVFPLPDGRANVGLGMLSHFISKDKVNLKTVLKEVIEEYPTLKARFANATLEDKVLGWGLPFGSKLGTLSGEGFVLTGDAGGLIDPMSGEGIGTGLYSGMLAADAVAKAIEKQDFSTAFFHEHYSKRVKRTMGFDFQFTYFLQYLCRFPWLLNFAIGRIGQNQGLQKILSMAMDGTAISKRILNPMFYVRLVATVIRGK